MGFRVTRKCGFPRDPPEHFSFQGDGSPLFIVAPGQTWTCGVRLHMGTLFSEACYLKYS